MANLTALLVRIGKENGRARYPNFNALPVVQSSGMDWAVYVDTAGLGWAYSNKSGHDDNDAGDSSFPSPVGERWGVLLIPVQFANEALAAFPADTRKLTESELTNFWDNYAQIDQPDETLDNDTLAALKTLRDLYVALNRPTPQRNELDQKINRALDPADTHPGVRKNVRRRWIDFKAKRGITFDPS